MWEVFANQSENFEISSTPFTVSILRQEYAKGISFITIKQRHYESNAFCKVKSDNLAREWSTESFWMLAVICMDLCHNLIQCIQIWNNTTTLSESRFQEYEKVYYKS